MTGHPPWTRLGVAGAALAFSVLFLHVPAALWAGNATELHVSVATVAGLGLSIVVAGTALFGIVLRRLPAVLQPLVASLAGPLGIIEWVYGLLLVGGMQVLDGVQNPLDFSKGIGLWELGLVAWIWLALASLARRRPGDAILVLTVLNVGLLAVSAHGILTTQRPDWTSNSDPAPVARLSPQLNVLVLLFDGLESGVAARVLDADPALKAAFDGFTFYPETLSTAPTTALSLPAIHSGDAYTGSGPSGHYFARAIARRSFLSRFAHAGYHVSLVNPWLGVCPEGVTTCTTRADVMGTSDSQQRHEILRLFDLSLFRVMPFRVKRWVWDEGRWRVSRQAGLPAGATVALEANEMVDRIGEQLVVDPNAPPTVKFLHSLATHTPYIMNDDCRTVGLSSLSNLDAQARCALRAAARLLGRLQAAGVYDTTVTLVLADHGINPGVYPHAARGSAQAWRHRSGSANPLFLFKPLRSRGPLRTATAAVSLVDVGATLCAAVSACTTSSGVPAGLAAAHRPRRFSDYTWRNEFWRSGSIPRITSYEVRGPLDRPDSWHRLE